MDQTSDGEDEHKRIKIFYDLQKEMTLKIDNMEEDRNKDFSDDEKVNKEEEKGIRYKSFRNCKNREEK